MEKMKKRVRPFRAKCRMIWALAKNDFKSKYATSQLGLFWAFFRPIVMAGVYIFVFSVIGRATPVGGVYPYALWMLPGLIVWFVFSDSVSSGVTTLSDYSYLVKNIKFDISVLPYVKVAAAFIIHTFFIFLIIILYIIFGLPINVTLVQLPYYYLATFCFTVAITRIVCTIQPFFKDLSVAMEIILMVGIWASPIMWSLEMIPQKLWWIFKANPMYYLVNGYRESYMGMGWFWNHWVQTAAFWGVTILLTLIGKLMFRKLSDHFADMI